MDECKLPALVLGTLSELHQMTGNGDYSRPEGLGQAGCGSIAGFLSYALDLEEVDHRVVYYEADGSGNLLESDKLVWGSHYVIQVGDDSSGKILCAKEGEPVDVGEYEARVLDGDGSRKKVYPSEEWRFGDAQDCWENI